MPSFSFTITGVTLSPTTGAAVPVATKRALRIDPTTNDLEHDGRRLQLIDGIEAVAQSLRARLQFFVGEWFLDEDYGTPYFQSVLGKQSSLIAVREVFRDVILETEGVLSITKLELRKGDQARAFVLDFSVTTDLGELQLSGTIGI